MSTISPEPLSLAFVVCLLLFGILGYNCGSNSVELIKDGNAKAVQEWKEEGALLQTIEQRQTVVGSPLQRSSEEFVETLRTIRSQDGSSRPSFRKTVLQAQALKPIDARVVRSELMDAKHLSAHPLLPAATRLEARYGGKMDLALDGKIVLSTRHEKPIPKVYDPVAEWLFFQTIGSVCFWALITFGCIAEHNDSGTDLHYPWRRIDGLVYAAVAAPMTAVVLLIKGFMGTVESMHGTDWTAWCAKVGKRAIENGYRLRLIRRLPTPVLTEVHPIRTTGATVPQAESPMDATDAADTFMRSLPDAAELMAVRADLHLGLGHLLADAGVRLWADERFALPPMEGSEPVHVAVLRAEDLPAYERIIRTERAPRTDRKTVFERLTYREYDGDAPGDIEIVHGQVTRAETGPLTAALRSVSRRLRGIDLRLLRSKDRRSTDPDHRLVRIFFGPEPTDDYPPGSAYRPLDRCHGEPFDGLERTDPAAEGRVLRDTEGVPVAQISDKGDVTLLVRGFRERTIGRKTEVLCRILHDAVATALDVRRPNTDAELATTWRDAVDEKRDRYITKRTTTVRNECERIERSLCDLDIRLDHAMQTIAKGRQQRKDDIERLAILKAKGVEDARAQAAQEFERLAAMPDVVAVDADDHGVVVYTRTTYITHAGRTYRIGRFRFDIRDDGSLRIFNLSNTARGTGYQHPHVRDTGYPCYGNIQTAVAKLQGDKDLRTLVTVLLRFLESYNHHGGVERIECWEEVSDEKE